MSHMLITKSLLHDLCSALARTVKKCIFMEWSVFSDLVTIYNIFCDLAPSPETNCVRVVYMFILSERMRIT